MGSKYDAIGEFLNKQSGAKITLSFDEVEQILGSPLPDSAHNLRQWWENGDHTQARGWMEAGWKVDKVQMGKNVTFIRVG